MGELTSKYLGISKKHFGALLKWQLARGDPRRSAGRQAANLVGGKRLVTTIGAYVCTDIREVVLCMCINF
jgi:hypothetical protein